MGPVSQMEADRTWKALNVNAVETNTYNCTIARLAMACGTKLTCTDCILAIAQLRRKQKPQDKQEADQSAQFRTAQNIENIDTGKQKLMKPSQKGLSTH